MSTLDLKLLRELRRLRGQLVSIALVVAAGVMSAVVMRSTYVSLGIARDSYYAEYRFADVFASLKRAPDAVMRQITDIPGVASAESRIKQIVNLTGHGLDGVARGLLVSLPETGEPRLNRIRITHGRLADPAATNEVVVSQRFAQRNRIEPGDTIIAVINGRQQAMRVVGHAISPEFIYEIDPAGTTFSDERLFGVLWTSQRTLAAATDMEGAFNDLALTLAPGATEKRVITAVDDVLRPYGGLGAYGRLDQISSRVVHDEIQQNRATASILPTVFLAVAAFLLHIVLHRLVTAQRVNIATLKAFGYDNYRIARHYLMFAISAVTIGVVAGLLLGRWLGAW